MQPSWAAWVSRGTAIYNPPHACRGAEERFSLAAVDWAGIPHLPALIPGGEIDLATLVNKMLMREMHTHMPSLPYLPYPYIALAITHQITHQA